MQSMRGLAILIPLVLITSFSYGCTTTQRKELLMEAAEAGKEYLAAQMPLITAKATEIAEAKIKAERERHYAVLDAQLAKLKVTKKDAEGSDVLDEDGKPVQAAKTWKDFDTVDPKGELDTIELATLTGWIGKEVATRVATGKLTKTEAGDIAKNSGGAALILALLLGAAKLAKRVGGKKTEPVPTASPTV